MLLDGWGGEGWREGKVGMFTEHLTLIQEKSLEQRHKN